MNFNIKTKIRINGREYAGTDEMPDDVRQIYEKAMRDNAQKTTTKIIFNGQEFASVENMPPEIRRLYEAAIGAVEAGQHPTPNPSGSPTTEQSQQIVGAIAAGNKIEAIKLYRSFTGSDLKVSKEFIEKIAVELHEKDPARFPAKPVGKGCLSVLLIFIVLFVLELLRVC